MEFMKEYLLGRVKKLNERKNKLLSQKKHIEINIENIDKTILKIKNNENTSSDIFFANSYSISENNFGNTTIKKLQQEYVKLTETIEPINYELQEIDGELENIRTVLKASEEKSELEDFDKYEGRKVIQIQEYERQRIARDMHDSIIQKLTGMIHKTELCQALVDKDVMRTKLELEVLGDIAHSCVEEIREIICDLRPMAIDDLGFSIVIKRMLTQYDETTSFMVDMDISDDIDDCNEVVGITIYRIIQEACNNSVKYSQGDNIRVKLYKKDNDIILIHEDDGIGIESNNNKQDLKHGLGLPMMKERIQLLSGKIIIGKGLGGKGTRIEVIVPIEKEN